MLVQQYLLHRFYGRKKTQGFSGQPSEVFEDNGIMHRFLHRFAPGKRAVAGHQHGRTVQRVTPGKGPGNQPASIELVIVFNFSLREQAGAGHRAMEIISVGGAQGRKRLAALGPGRSMETVGVHNTPIAPNSR